MPLVVTLTITLLRSGPKRQCHNGIQSLHTGVPVRAVGSLLHQCTMQSHCRGMQHHLQRPTTMSQSPWFRKLSLCGRTQPPCTGSAATAADSLHLIGNLWTLCFKNEHLRGTPAPLIDSQVRAVGRPSRKTSRQCNTEADTEAWMLQHGAMSGASLLQD